MTEAKVDELALMSSQQLQNMTDTMNINSEMKHSCLDRKAQLYFCTQPKYKCLFFFFESFEYIGPESQKHNDKLGLPFFTAA